MLKFTKSFASSFFNAFLENKSYVFNFAIVVFLLLLLLIQHDWNIKPSSESTSNSLLDFSKISDVNQKKFEFFKFLRPKIQRANQKIKYQQALFQMLKQSIAKDKYHPDSSNKKMIRLGVSYGLKKEKVLGQLDELAKRIDIIPEALVLAQAANESAWGASRFAKKANNLFGQWCYTKGCGIVPKKRNSNAKHEVQKFNSVQDAVTSYMKNLNSHSAYANLRNIRATLRKNGQAIKATKLARGLTSYSERGDEYVNEIISMISSNHLE